MDDLRTALERLLNQFSAENTSNTPDFVLANYLHASLAAFDEAVREREIWYGRDPNKMLQDETHAISS